MHSLRTLLERHLARRHHQEPSGSQDSRFRNLFEVITRDRPSLFRVRSVRELGYGDAAAEVYAVAAILMMRLCQAHHRAYERSSAEVPVRFLVSAMPPNLHSASRHTPNSAYRSGK